MRYNNHDIKVVWLDLDDTIIDFKTNSRRALHRLWKEEDVVNCFFPTPEEWHTVYEKHNHRLWDMYSRSEVSQPELRLKRFQLPLEEGGVDRDEAIRVARIFDTLYLDHLAEERELIPGSIALLQFLHKKGLSVGCLSNGFKEVQFRKIRNCGLEKLFDLVVLSDDIGVNKPDRRLFDYAASLTRFPSPDNHLLIGDNAATDIEGAVRAGWQSIQFLREPTAAVHPEASLAVEKLSQVIEALEF